jgi:hypothetical protein
VVLLLMVVPEFRLACANDMDDGADNTVKTGDLCRKPDNDTRALGKPFH